MGSSGTSSDACRQCIRCRTEKPESEFPTVRSRACNACRAELTAANEDAREKRNAYAREYNRAYREAHRERIREYHRELAKKRRGAQMPKWHRQAVKETLNTHDLQAMDAVSGKFGKLLTRILRGERDFTL